jgi:rare lipoprotein A
LAEPFLHTEFRRLTPARPRAAVALLALVAACAQLPPSGEAPAEAPAAPAAEPPAPPTARPEPVPPSPKPPRTIAHTERGVASFYAASFAGKKTANGDTFDPDALTMAHRTLPFGTKVRVTNPRNHRSVEVVVNDRGPMVAGRIADLSPAAARAIGLTDGVAEVTLEVVGSIAE